MTPRVSLAAMCGDAQRHVAARMLASVFKYPHRICDEVVFFWNGRGESPLLPAPRGAHAGVEIRIVPHTWPYDFSAARNANFDVCRGDWIIWFDCDDILERPKRARDFAARHGKTQGGHAPLASDLHVYLESLPPDIGAVWCPYAYSPTETQLHPRILRRSDGWRWDGRVQERLSAAREPQPSWTEFWGLYWRQMSVQTEAERQDRNIPLLEMAVAGGDRAPFTLYYLARAREDQGRMGEANDLYCEAAFCAQRAGNKPQLYQIAITAAQFALRHRDYALAADFASYCRETRPDLPEGYFAGCIADAHRDRPREAIDLFEAGGEAMIRNRTAPRFSYIAEFLPGPVIWASAAACYIALGKKDRAAALLRLIPAAERDGDTAAMMTACRA